MSERDRSSPDKNAPDKQPADAPAPDKPPRTQASAPSKDLAPLVKGWDYEPGTINVRKINGQDGQPKLQMRLELGMLQMEITGRPDGARPHGCESLLEYYEAQLKDHNERNGTELGFHLTPIQCQSLREESQLYYQRYLSLFVLEDFSGVVRDTARNLRVLDLCGKFAVEERDRVLLEQFRPYILMMHARAEASIAVTHKREREALSIVAETLEQIRDFFAAIGQPEAYTKANEVAVLRRFAREIRRKLPVDPMQKLKAQLQRAVKQERYEDAARLRDQIAGAIGKQASETGSESA